MRANSGNIGAGGTVRGDSGRTFSGDRGTVRGDSGRTFATDGGRYSGGWHHGRHGHGGRFAIGAGYGYPYYNSYAYSEGDCYLVRRRVLTRVGWRVRRVQVCD